MYRFIFLCLLSIFTFSVHAQKKGVNKQDYIDIDKVNPWYWHYQGKTLLLLGGTWQDNLFNHPQGLEDHLDVLAEAGGNYLRNTMSHRNVGNVFAYKKGDDGKFDLDQFNEEYWERFENFLRLTHERGLVVQLEIWDPWDMYEDHQSFGGWSHHPYNPKNNSNYSAESSGMPEEINYPPTGKPSEHPFFKTIPELGDNTLLLAYQKAYMDKLLEHTLAYPNILYCVHNEIGEKVEFGDYWADYIWTKAAKEEVKIHVTDMRRSEDVRSEDHAHIKNNPERYSFLDISQNNAYAGLGQQHYENILYIKSQISDYPRPVNNNKNYGAARHGEEESVARMGRIVFAGSASARFHRPHPLEDPSAMYEKSDYGLGLSPRAQKVIKSLRLATDELDLNQTHPRNDLLKDPKPNSAYLLANTGIAYACYFPVPGEATLLLEKEELKNTLTYQWINLDDAEWSKNGTISLDEKTTFKTPDDRNHWILVLTSK
ncbi:hypothetical protein [Pleomorphovibrio marinus]|uniref:hypothetical protein n=1 Tax=Pleomorphovibrio marinus TaxID=2164132 RepID=UPI0018E587BE|nr:hypothetical protein [Pleomorphovibrio marinus]